MSNENQKYKLLVTCVKNGGMYALEWQCDQFHLTKVLNGTFRGMVKYGENFVVVTDLAVLILDENFNVLQRRAVDKDIAYYAYHGVFIRENEAYIVETERNSIGIYELPSLSRIGEISFAPPEKDMNHVNDIYMIGDTMYVSMFTTEGEWRKQPSDSGVILTYNLKDGKIESVLYDKLCRPHTVICHKGDIYYCNSSRMEVKKGQDVIFEASGFTRGLAIKDNYIFVGQSNSTSRLTKTITDNACGIHVYDQAQKSSQFIHLPVNEVYGLLLCD